MNVDAEKLKALRTESVLSQRELSEASGVPRNTIARIESGRHKSPHPSTVRKLAAALGVRPGELVKKPDA